MADLDVRPLTPVIGAEIQGVDLRSDLDAGRPCATGLRLSGAGAARR
jgi:hypothetical protein